jgi:hypothetical protein
MWGRRLAAVQQRGGFGRIANKSRPKLFAKNLLQASAYTAIIGIDS